MYNFIDVNEESTSAALPSEALQLNGEYIENLIDGYRTLNVRGRESLPPDLSYYETGARDGATLKNKRFPVRVITVKYQLIAESNEAFREAYNKLGGILNVENAELIFNDETDKFYRGTPSAIGEVEPGINAVVGEFEILCTDPFKYSVIEYEAEPDIAAGSVLIDYNGTYKAFPVLEADFYSETEVAADGETAGTLTGNGDCGYIAFFNENEKIIQLGDPDEIDGVAGAYAKAQTLCNQTFLTDTAWGTTAKALWTVNNGKVLPSTVEQLGSVKMGVASYNSSASSATTSASLLNIKSPHDGGSVKYVVKAKATNRTANTVTVTATVTASLIKGASFGSNIVLVASVLIGGYWHDVTMKKKGETWASTAGHTKNISFTVSGLDASANALTGIKFKAYRDDSLSGNAGVVPETACNNLPIAVYAEDVAGSHYLTAASYGTAANAWHGPSITRQIGADASGEVGAKNFVFTYKQKMCIGKGTGDTYQCGAFQAQLADASGNIVAGVRITKHKVGKSGDLRFYVNGVEVNTTPIDLHYNNYYFGSTYNAVQTTTITKTGNTINFAVGGYKRQFVEDALADVKVTQITFSFEQYDTHKPLEYNGLFRAKFVKNNCETFKDIPNKFSADDVLEADCKDGAIYLNGILSPELGALGNDWEEFYLTPGLNQIGIAFSDWVSTDYAPRFKVRYREVFL